MAGDPRPSLFSPQRFWMKEKVLGSKLFIGWLSWEMGACRLFRADQRLHTVYREECPGRGAYWLNPQSL